MKVRRYEAKDFEQVREWGRGWGSEYREDQFPGTGFIVDGVAAYFLYQTDSSVCWLENLITVRGVDASVKDRALNLLIEAILDEAKALGYTIAYATTDINTVAKRAREGGAGVKPYQFLITKNLITQLQ